MSEAYDRYGNRTAQSISSGCSGITCPTNSISVSTTTNQITTSPESYDLSGNMTNDGTNKITYDGEARAVTATNGGASGTYTYDGNGLRAKKVASGTTTVYIFSGSRVIAEYTNGAAPSSPSAEYVYAGGALLTKIIPTLGSSSPSGTITERISRAPSSGNLSINGIIGMAELYLEFPRRWG